jgi:hypothetical protein
MAGRENEKREPNWEGPENAGRWGGFEEDRIKGEKNHRKCDNKGRKEDNSRRDRKLRNSGNQGNGPRKTGPIRGRVGMAEHRERKMEHSRLREPKANPSKNRRYEMSIGL